MSNTTNSITKHLIVVAGGKGLRMGTEIPKQFIPILGKPILMHTLEIFSQVYSNINIILVLPIHQKDYWNKLCLDYQFTLSHQITNGGETRFHSVKNGLKLISSDGLIAVHDAVRPLVSKNTIINCFNMAAEKGNAIPYVPINESIRRILGEHNSSVLRSEYVAIQTPQVFDSLQLKEAYHQDFSEEFTDDASVVEKMARKIYLVEGNVENIKITTPRDLKIAEVLMQETSN